MRRMLAALLLALAFIPTVAARTVADTHWTLVKSYPHDRDAFTEGLFFLDGSLYESTGMPGQSDIREVRLKDGRVLRRVRLEPRYFGEGIVNWRDRIVSLTWRHRTGFVWDRARFARLASFAYEGEGWGLTQDGRQLIMSDGSAELRFLDPETLTETRRVTVTWNGQAVDQLNELEFVKGEVLANIWHDSRIARIDPETGAIKGWIDLTPLLRKVKARDPEAVANGIAYDAAGDRLFVTGKYWPKIFEIRLGR